MQERDDWHQVQEQQTQQFPTLSLETQLHAQSTVGRRDFWGSRCSRGSWRIRGSWGAWSSCRIVSIWDNCGLVRWPLMLLVSVPNLVGLFPLTCRPSTPTTSEELRFGCFSFAHFSSSEEEEDEILEESRGWQSSSPRFLHPGRHGRLFSKMRRTT